MATRANVIIGSLAVATITAILVFVLWFLKFNTTQQRSALRIVFAGSATGLRNGASVTFNGIRVGEVTSVTLDNPRRVVAHAMVENIAPIRKDTRVGLEFQGLTGAAAIALKGGEEAAPPASPDEDGIATLTADPKALQAVTEAIRGTLRNIDRIVAENQETVKGSIHNIERFTASLADNAERVDSIMRTTDSVVGKAYDLMSGLDALAGGKRGGELLPTVASIREMADKLNKRSGLLIADSRHTLSDISRAVNNLDRNPTRLLFGAGARSTPAPAPGERKKRP